MLTVKKHSLYGIFHTFLLYKIKKIVIAVSCAETQNNTIKWPTLKPEWSYCYELTWFGPDFDNITRYNGTCPEYLDETRGKGVPCAPPIVISCKLGLK